MRDRTVHMLLKKQVVLIAHDSRRAALLDWVRHHRTTLSQHELYATKTADVLLAGEHGLSVTLIAGDSHGDDQRLNAGIAADRVGFMVFLWDSTETQPREANVKALLRLAVVRNVPIAGNRAVADYLLSAQSMLREHDPMLGHRRDRERGPSWNRYHFSQQGSGVRGLAGPKNRTHSALDESL